MPDPGRCPLTGQDGSGVTKRAIRLRRRTHSSASTSSSAAQAMPTRASISKGDAAPPSRSARMRLASIRTGLLPNSWTT